jgi:hypothetical protein
VVDQDTTLGFSSSSLHFPIITVEAAAAWDFLSLLKKKKKKK